jgi:hypothetical protein
MTDLASIATTLLANFATIRIPAQNDAADLSGDWWGAAKVWRTEKRAVRAYRDELRAALVAHGHRQFLDYLEPDRTMDGGCTSFSPNMLRSHCLIRLPTDVVMLVTR